MAINTLSYTIVDKRKYLRRVNDAWVDPAAVQAINEQSGYAIIYLDGEKTVNVRLRGGQNATDIAKAIFE